MKDDTAIIFNIQRYSIHDGPGIRTIVFFKGCPLHCLWCSNPESQSGKIQVIYNNAKTNNGIQNNCIEIEPNMYDRYVKEAMISQKDAIQIEGKKMTISEVMDEVLKDKVFYDESGGGVTLSGGEVLMQHQFAFKLLKALKEKKIHTAIETTGYTSKKIFASFIENVDLLLYDIKHYDRQKHYETTGVYNDIIIDNLKTAVEKRKNVIVRIPVIPCINSTLEDAKYFCELLNKIGVNEVNLLPFHQFGQKKYELLHRHYVFKNIPQLHPEDLSDYRQVFLNNGIHCYF